MTLSLADGRFDGVAAPGVWGRYLSGVEGVRADVIADPFDPQGESDVYQTFVTIPGYGSPVVFQGGGTHRIQGLDFSRFAPTSPANPNLIRYYARDVWGLRSAERTIAVDVVPRPKFYTSVTWNPDSFRYDLNWRNDLINFDRTTSQIVGFTLPIIGDKKNKFLVSASAQGSASLNPADPITLPIKAKLNLTAVDYTIFDKTWEGSTSIGDHLTLYTSVAVSPRTLDPTAAAVSFQLRDYPIFDIRTPKIPLFAFGIPGIAAIQASFSLGLEAALDAGVKIGLDPKILADPFTAPSRIGLMSPTFVRPEIVGSAIISGDLTVLGFDLASLEGSLRLGLNITLGLDNADPSAVIPFSDLGDRLAIKVTGSLGFGMAASFLGFEIWSWEPDPYEFDIADTSSHGGIITNEPGFPPAPSSALDSALVALQEMLARAAPLPGGGAPFPPPVFRKGSDLVGAYAPASPPQLLIDQTDGSALTVQVTDLDPSPTVTRSGLVYASRPAGGGPWSALTEIPGAGDATNPVLTLTYTDSGSAMLVYQKINSATPPASQTLAGLLASRDLRYRYWNGTAWGPEQVLAGNAGADSDAATAFSALGNIGVAAWVHNTAAIPMGENGMYARNSQEINVSTWDAVTQTWNPGEALTADAVADSQPAVFADEDTRALYVVWIRDTASGNELAFSINDGTGWSAPAALPVSGLEPGGTFTSVALGAEAPGRMNVLFSYRRALADHSVDSRLYNRPTTLAEFAASAAIEPVSAGANYSHLRTTSMPDGSLVATWHQGDGVVNEVFASVLRPAGARATPWSQPARLTASEIVEEHPAVAIEPDGAFRLLYEMFDPSGTGGGAAGAPVGDAIPVVPGIGSFDAPDLPDIAFADRLLFDQRTLAIEGSSAQGAATIVNRGRAATDVTIEYLAGPPGAEVVLKSEVVRLSPGATYLASHAFPIGAGVNVFSIRAATPGLEIGGDADNVTSYTLTAAPDVEIVDFQLLDPSGPPGPGNPLLVTLRNNSSVAVGAFDLVLYSGDPLFPQSAALTLATVRVPGIAPGDSIVESVSVPLVEDAGVYLYTAFADAGGEIPEAVEGNNRRSIQFEFAADPRIASDTPDGEPSLQAVLADTSGIDNLTVSLRVRNAGQAPTDALTVRLFHRLGDDEWAQIGLQTLDPLASGAQMPVQFVVDALAGDNRYRVVLDAPPGSDVDPVNNAAESLVVVYGFADLVLPDAPTIDVASPIQGQPANVTVTLNNTGIAAAQNVLVEVFAKIAGQAPFTVGARRLARVAPLSSQSLAIGIDTSALSGDYELYVAVDRGDEVLELEDLNNTSPAIAFSVLPDTPDAPVVSEATFEFNSLPHRLRYRFSKNVSASLGLGDLSLTNLTTGQVLGGVNAATDVSWDSSTQTATFRLVRTLPEGNYAARLSSAGVTDGMGRALDGDGDGVAGGDHLFSFFILLGDFNRDRVVNHDDFLIQYANFGGTGKTPSQGDVDGDADVDFVDYQLFGLRFGNALPAPAPSLSAAEYRRPKPRPLVKAPASPPDRKSVPTTRTAASPSPFATRMISPSRATPSLLAGNVSVRKLSKPDRLALFR
jgi:hypothetical protein